MQAFNLGHVIIFGFFFYIDNSLCVFSYVVYAVSHSKTHSAAISFVKSVGVIITSCQTKSATRRGQQLKIACYIPAGSF